MTVKTILFCLPYAGASATIYWQWKGQLSPHIELRPVELAGRGARYDEPYAASIADMLKDAVTQIGPQVQEVPYAIYGHSMGAVLAYELYYLLLREGYPPPVHLLLSGRPAPLSDRKRTFSWSSLKQRLLAPLSFPDGRIPAEIKRRPELAAKFKKILNADVRILETYRLDPARPLINCPVTVFAGLNDKINREEIQLWNRHTVHNCEIVWIKGDHFFLHSHMEEVVSVINQTIPAAIHDQEGFIQWKR
ncbi:hypothetical protein BBG47_18560 [Paenibacillus sp. KS1]|uniref:thioesterase II family protein n=1 Tax=Paenibacillus sp. KS1 TaxID=1849249 RepID=UPI000806478B|nr:alpha/beta fold hydrolase [Paenibacillus sp. KS1]OBY78046.1 hypothetical protein BBG47_18560 [Paenibacillus sp. KS1]